MILNHNIWYIDQGAHTRSSWKLLLSFFMIFCKNKNKTETENGETECGTKLKKNLSVCVCVCVCVHVTLTGWERDTVTRYTNTSSQKSKWEDWNNENKTSFFSSTGVREIFFRVWVLPSRPRCKTTQRRRQRSFFRVFLVSFSSSTRHSRLIYIQIQKQSHFDTFFAKKMMTTCFFLQNSHNNGEPARRETGESTAAEFQISRQFFFSPEKSNERGRATERIFCALKNKKWTWPKLNSPEKQKLNECLCEAFDVLKMICHQVKSGYPKKTLSPGNQNLTNQPLRKLPNSE